MKVTCPLEQSRSADSAKRLSDQDQGHILARRGEVLEARAGLIGRLHAHDAVVPRVAVVELACSVAERVVILVNDDENGVRHLSHALSPRRTWARASTSDQKASTRLFHSSGTS